MWDTVRVIITQFGLPGIVIIGIAFLIYILYTDRNKQALKDTAREERLNQMTDKVINITEQVSRVVSANTEVSREMVQTLKEIKDTSTPDHQHIVDKVESLGDNMKDDHHRLEDKLNDIKK